MGLDTRASTLMIWSCSQVGIESFNTAQLGLAYVWAQRVSGLSFPSVSDGEAAVGSAKQRVSELYLPGVVKAIKKRLRTRISLCQQLQTLGKQTVLFMSSTLYKYLFSSSFFTLKPSLSCNVKVQDV